MQIILNSIQELKELTSLIGEKVPSTGDCGQTKREEPKIEIKPAAEKTKKEKSEQTKVDKSKVEEKKNEVPEVEAEVTGVDETPAEQPKDAEVTEENNEPEVTNITKEMVRAICSKAIKAGKAAEVKNIVSKYGASKLPNLKEECYADAYKDVEALL
ncbi:hypothetical protein [uncultured Clostridium sp.]|uniref:hypothetical protein n=1 Tax=uncultured Clostridium sp. TaxID=59620 RepID=UPI0028EE04BF|nr:hypothetical protein [uncultured Clostridium sp.]